MQWCGELLARRHAAMLWSHGSKLRKVETLSGRLKCTNAWRRLLVKMQRWGDEMPWGSLGLQLAVREGPVCVAKGCWSQKRALVDFAIDAENDSGLQAHHHPGRYTDLWTQRALESTPQLAAEQWVMSWVYCKGLLDVLTDVVSRGQCFHVSFDSSEVL